MLWVSMLMMACRSSIEVPESDSRERVAVEVSEAPPEVTSRIVSGVLDPVKDSTIAATRGGRIIRLGLDPGERVNVGTPLVWLDDREAQANLKIASGRLADAEANLEASELKMTRVEAVADQVSVAEYDAARIEQDRARALLVTAQAQVDLASAVLDDHTLRAPFGGVLSSLTGEVGEMLMPGQAVARVVDDSELEVEVRLLADEVAQLMQSSFVIESGDVSVPAVLRHAAVAAEPATLTWPATLLVSQTQTLRAGMPVRVQIGVTTEGVDAVFSMSALNEAGQVWVVGADDRVSLRDVQLVGEFGGQLLVKGVMPGERVVVHGAQALEEDEIVVVLEASP